MDWDEFLNATNDAPIETLTALRDEYRVTLDGLNKENDYDEQKARWMIALTAPVPFILIVWGAPATMSFLKYPSYILAGSLGVALIFALFSITTSNWRFGSVGYGLESFKAVSLPETGRIYHLQAQIFEMNAAKLNNIKVVQVKSWRLGMAVRIVLFGFCLTIASAVISFLFITV